MERIDTHAGAYIISAVIRCMRITRPDGRDIEYRFAVLPKRWGGQYLPDQQIIEINESQLQSHPARIVSVFLHEIAHLLIRQSPSFSRAYRLDGEPHDPAFFVTDAALLFRASIPPMPSEITELARAAWADSDEYLSGQEVIATVWQSLDLYDIQSATRLPPDAVWAPDRVLARAAPWISWALSHAESLARDDSLTPAGIAERALQLYIKQVEINRERLARKQTTQIKKVG